VTTATSITSTNFIGSIDGVLGGVTPAAATVTTFTSTGIDDNSSSTTLTIDSNQRALYGDTTTRPIGGANFAIQLIGTSGQTSGFAAQRFTADNGGAGITLAKSRGASPGTYTAVQDNDILGALNFYGADGTDMGALGAQMFARVNGTPGSNDMPTELVFSTTTDGSDTSTERMWIQSNGRVAIATTGGLDPTGRSEGCNVWDNNSGNYALHILHDGNNQDRYGIKITAGADNGSGQTFCIRADDGDGDNIGYIENNAGTFQLVDVSDEYTKDNIRATSILGLDIINNLRVIDFERKKNGVTVVGGFSAQDMLSVFPCAVSGTPRETEKIKRKCGKIETRRKMMGISQGRLIPVLVKALQEETKKREAIEQDIENIKQKIGKQ
jgi:hypothetical protein